MAIAKITKAYIRHYRDNGQTMAYVEWIDSRGQTGRTEGGVKIEMTGCNNRGETLKANMGALFARAAREGVKITRETW